jgi:hypothetical protein
MPDASLLCVICRKRRPRRFCPGVHGNICSICCGTEREQTVRCPLDCKYLIESRERETPPLLSEKELPHREIRISEEFLAEHETLLILVARSAVVAALETDGAVDSDVREALEAVIRTYQTRESGLYYETRPDNLIAARVAARLQEEIQNGREALREETGLDTIRDSDILKMLVFLTRLSVQHDNKRRLGRSFVHFLLSFFPPKPVTEPLII